MKAVVLAFIITFQISMLVAGQLYSQGCLPENPYFGLYTDETHTSSCVDDFTWPIIEMWGCVLPSTVGIICIEFAIAYPSDSNIFPSTVTLSPDISVTLGDLESGFSACYIGCQMDWNWVFHQSITVLPDASPSWVEILPHPDVGYVIAGTCEEGG